MGFFLGGLVVRGGSQGWWIEPVLGRYFRDGVAPLGLALGALPPTLVVLTVFLLF